MVRLDASQRSVLGAPTCSVVRGVAAEMRGMHVHLQERRGHQTTAGKLHGKRMGMSSEAASQQQASRHREAGAPGQHRARESMAAVHSLTYSQSILAVR